MRQGLSVTPVHLLPQSIHSAVRFGHSVLPGFAAYNIRRAPYKHTDDALRTIY